MEHSPLNPTRIANVNGRSMFISFNASLPLSHHHFLNGSLGPLGSHPPPYNSLPCFAYPSLRQPALLPLPDTKSTPILSPAKKTATTTRFNQQQHQRKSRPSAKPKNGKATILATDQKSKAESSEEEQEEREDVMESVYSISPPPSSLPLPRFSLPRPKSAAPAASCVIEAVEGGGGIDIGATNSLRRLLRL